MEEKATYMHRHIEKIEENDFLHQVSYQLDSEGKIDIQKMTVHPIGQDGIIGENLGSSEKPNEFQKQLGVAILIYDDVISMQ